MLSYSDAYYLLQRAAAEAQNCLRSVGGLQRQALVVLILQVSNDSRQNCSRKTIFQPSGCDRRRHCCTLTAAGAEYGYTILPMIASWPRWWTNSTYTAVPSSSVLQLLLPSRREKRNVVCAANCSSHCSSRWGAFQLRDYGQVRH